MVCAGESLANLQTSPNPRWGPGQQSSGRVIGSWCVGSRGAAGITAAVPLERRAAPARPHLAPLPPLAPPGCLWGRPGFVAKSAGRSLPQPKRGPWVVSSPLATGNALFSPTFVMHPQAIACFEEVGVIPWDFPLSEFLSPTQGSSCPRIVMECGRVPLAALFWVGSAGCHHPIP